MCDKRIYNEATIVKQLINGDQSAFREIYDHYRNKLFSIAYKLLRDKASAEDTVQEVFLKLWINKNMLNQVDNFNAYITTITRNNLFNRLKSLAYARKYVKDIEKENEPSGQSAGQIFEHKELYTQLKKAVNNLPAQQKKVYQLGKVHGLKYEEIAQVLHISKETVKSHMSEGIRSIKRQLLQNHELTSSWIILLLISVEFFLIFFN